jgi:aminobenzoyl-glutamate utilization protein B
MTQAPLPFARKLTAGLALAALFCPAATPIFAQTATPAVASSKFTPDQTEALKKEIIAKVDGNAKLVQVMIDTLYSFSELGFQEFETSKYLTDLLEKNGFKVEKGIAGIPTAYMATWSNGTGGPVIALGSDIDCIPQASQKPGVAYHDPIVPGAPGHGEGHNSGNAVNIVAALAVKDIMVKNHISGTLKIWPGVAEEELGSKAYYIRDGYFKGIDAALFSHVGDNLGSSYGGNSTNGLNSVQYHFHGESAHAAAAPWRGRSALDAVELMDVGWNFRREHLRLQQRSHYVITDGGDQPNVVPQSASVWYFFREADYEHMKSLWETGDHMAEGAAKMTDTTFDSTLVGTAWPGFFNKPIAEEITNNAKLIGLPKWSDDDETLAKALQKELKVPEKGLADKLDELKTPKDAKDYYGGGSDDIGDISWNVPTIVLRYPSNIPNLPGHNWANGIAMATPIAHKGAVAGAKVQALTLFALMTQPKLLDDAKAYFKENQTTKDAHYIPFLRPTDKPSTFLNKAIMDKYKPELKKYYYDAAKYPTYLDQLGIKYPTVRTASTPAAPAKSEGDLDDDGGSIQ